MDEFIISLLSGSGEEHGNSRSVVSSSAANSATSAPPPPTLGQSQPLPPPPLPSASASASNPLGPSFSQNQFLQEFLFPDPQPPIQPLDSFQFAVPAPPPPLRKSKASSRPRLLSPGSQTFLAGTGHRMNSASSSGPRLSSVLNTDMTSIVAYLNARDGNGNGNGGTSQSQQGGGGGTYSQYFGYDEHTIPKPYRQLTAKDCAKSVAQAIRQIILYTCDNDFRQKCFDCLGVNSSFEAEVEVQERLNKMLENPPAQVQRGVQTQTQPSQSSSASAVAQNENMSEN